MLYKCCTNVVQMLYKCSTNAVNSKQRFPQGPSVLYCAAIYLPSVLVLQQPSSLASQYSLAGFYTALNLKYHVVWWEQFVNHVSKVSFNLPKHAPIWGVGIIFDRMTSDETLGWKLLISEEKHFSCKSLNFWWNLVALLLLLSTIAPALALAFPSVGHAKLFYVAIGNLCWQLLLCSIFRVFWDNLCWQCILN